MNKRLVAELLVLKRFFRFPLVPPEEDEDEEDEDEEEGEGASVGVVSSRGASSVMGVTESPLIATSGRGMTCKAVRIVITPLSTFTGCNACITAFGSDCKRE